MTSTQLIFPYRGVYVHHVGHDQAVAEANQVLFFNAHEGYRVSHPVAGGDGSLTLVIEEPQLRELAPLDILQRSSGIRFRRRRLRIDARAQALVALLRHSLHQKVTEPLEAEVLALTLVRRTLGPRTSHAPGATIGRQKLVERAKLVLSSDLKRRWTLAEIAGELRVSPVYLTQVFQQVEGLPLYQYQLRLRLARALDLLARYDDLHHSRSRSWLLQSQPLQLCVPPARRILSFGVQTPCPQALTCQPAKIAKDSDSAYISVHGLLVVLEFRDGREAMAERTCAACDCKLGRDVIPVKIGGKTVEVCCEDCAQKLREADASTMAKRG